ncbi:MAG: ABC transporter ATP-binding protein [Ignisphaera sp.]
MRHVELECISKRFGSTIAVDNVSLSVNLGEIFSLLGPSGCGKTTTLRIIAGLVKPDSGRVYIGGNDVTDIPTEKRNVGMVFQNYALWPHMTVYDNIAFGLKLRRLPQEEIRRRVKEVLALVKLEGFENRYPTQLSGGQQQRVSLARALALNPEVILLDEPLSNLDAKLREELRYELRTLLKSLKITSVYVTHDQLEALTISDRIAVMNHGRIVQIGTPREVYEEPTNRFVAAFIGESTIIEGKLIDVEDNYGVVKLKGGIKIRGRIPRGVSLTRNSDVMLIIRPEAIHVSEETPGENILVCKPVREIYIGERIEYRLDCEGYELKLKLPSNKPLSMGSEISVSLDSQRTIIVGKKEE